MIANRFLLRPGDRVVGVGEAVRLALIRNEGLPADRVEVIYNGIPLDRFSASAGDRAAVRDELGIDPEAPVLVQVARLDYLKDHATAVRAMAHLARERPDARLLLVGEGPERPLIEDLVGRLGLGAHVRLLGQRADVSRLLATADLALLTSISEGIPLTLIEAMAAGLPIVSTRVGGVAEVVEDGRTGLLAPSGDPRPWPRTPTDCPPNPTNATSWDGRARAGARRLLRGRMHPGYLQLYEDLLGFARRRTSSTARELPLLTPLPITPETFPSASPPTPTLMPGIRLLDRPR